MPDAHLYAGPGRWVWRALIVFTFCILLATTALVAVSATRSSSNHSILARQELVSKRNDCIAEVSTTFRAVHDVAADLAQQSTNNLFLIVFRHTPAGTALTAAENDSITSQLTAVADAERAYRALPSVADAVEHGYVSPVDGVHHGPCPKV